MASTAQITANRFNAQLSTGPRSEDGKLASSQNARRHGFTSTQLCVPEAAREEFEKFRHDLHCDVRPEGALEDSLFERLLLANWNLRRITRYETELLDETNPFAPGAPGEADAFDRLARYRRDLERSSQRALAELRKLQTQRAALLQLKPKVVKAFTESVPLADLTVLTDNTDSILQRGLFDTTVSFYPSRDAAIRASAAKQKPTAVSQPRPARAAPDTEDLLKSFGL